MEPIRDLTNVLLKPEPKLRWQIQDGITLLVCFGILAVVVFHVASRCATWPWCW